MLCIYWLQITNNEPRSCVIMRIDDKKDIIHASGHIRCQSSYLNPILRIGANP